MQHINRRNEVQPNQSLKLTWLPVARFNAETPCNHSWLFRAELGWSATQRSSDVLLKKNIMDESDWELEFESWEDHYDLHEQRDYPSLVALCESEVRRRPDDLHAAERLAEAYMLNKEYEKVIEFAANIHREYPDISAFQHRILDALYALEKDENDFDWTIRPKILRLTSDFADHCYEYLRPKRNPRSIHDLTFEIGQGNYLAFTDDDLLEYLKRDARFVIDGSHPATADIKVARKRKSRTNG